MKRELLIPFRLAAFILGSTLAIGVRAAPCCSSNAAAPSLISGDDSAQVSFSFAKASIVADAPAEGPTVFRNSNVNEVTQTFRLDGALLLGDLWQVGASAPLAQHSLSSPVTNNSTAALGDIRLGAAYEWLPEWDYSLWRPKGYVFAQLTLPTGKSIYDLTVPNSTDAIGQGFFTLSLGTLLLKRWGDFDAYLLPQVSYSLGRSSTEEVTGSSTQVGPAFGIATALGLGYSPWGGNLRLGVRLQPVYLSSRTVTNALGTGESSFQFSGEGAAELSYLIADSWSISGSYSDQTLMGNAVNSNLSRTVAVSLQHRWPR